MICSAPLGAADGRFVLKGTCPAYAPDRAFHTEHIRLDLKIDMGRETLEGLATTTLRAITKFSQTMVFDAVNFQIRSVRVDGRPQWHLYRVTERTEAWPEVGAALSQRLEADLAVRPSERAELQAWRARVRRALSVTLHAPDGTAVSR